MIYEMGESNSPNLEPKEFIAFVELLREWKENPWNGDSGIAAFSEAFLQILPPNLDDIFQKGLYEIYGLSDAAGNLPSRYEFLLIAARYLEDIDDPFSVDSLTATTTSYKGRKLYHAVRFVLEMMKDQELMERTFSDYGQEIPHINYKYPDDFDKPEAFRELFDFIMSNPNLGDLLTLALDRFRIRTTVISRYLIPYLELLKEFGDKPIRLGSVGVGSGYGEQALISNFRFEDVEIIESYDAVGYTVDEELTAKINNLKQEPLNLVQLIGFDLLVKDKAQNVWSRSSLLLDEHKDAEFMRRYDKVAEVDDPRLDFHRLDITDEIAVDEYINKYKEKNGESPEFDAFLAITVFYQLKTEAEVEAAIRNIGKFVKEDGFILVQDSIGGTFEGDYNYVTKKIYPHKKGIPTEVIAISKNDRCRQIFLSSRFNSPAHKA